jgi:anti-sigma B factor antagonist
VDEHPQRGLVLAVRYIDGVAVLAARGELDALTAPRLDETIKASFAKEATAAVVVDLLGLEFLASAGMTVLLDGQRAACQRKIWFGVVADGPRTSRPMKLMGLDQELDLYSTLEAALDSAARQAASVPDRTPLPLTESTPSDGRDR